MNKHVLKGITSAMMSLGVCSVAPAQTYSTYMSQGAVQTYARQNRAGAAPMPLGHPSQNNSTSSRTEKQLLKQGQKNRPVSLIQQATSANEVYLNSVAHRDLDLQDATSTKTTSTQTRTSETPTDLEIETRHAISELIVIDQAVADKHLIYRQLKPGMEIREINALDDGLAQLSSILSEYHDLDALHVFSHGSDGVIQLGNSQVDEAKLNRDINALSDIDGALRDGADLLLYGCELAKTEDGEQLLELIASKANVDVAASSDITGNVQLGGDWELEIQTGDIETELLANSIAMQDFSTVLLDDTVDGNEFNSTGYADPKTATVGSYTVRLSTDNAGDNSLYCGSSANFCYEDFDSAGNAGTKIYLDFTGGQEFNITSLYLYSDGAQDFTFESNNGDSSTLSLGAGGSSSPTLNWTGITKLTIRRTDNGTLGRLRAGSFVLTNIQNPSTPTISGVSYDSSTGNLVVTGTNFEAKTGAANDITVNKLTLTGEGGGGSAYTLTSSTNVEIDSATQFTVPISGTDKLRIDALLNKNGTSADDSTTYNLAAADDFVANVTAGDTSIATNGITVSNYANPNITSSTYDASTGVLVVTGTGFSSVSGASNDVIANTFTFTGDGGDTYTLTDSSNVDVTSATGFTITLSSTDKQHVNGILNKDATSAESGQTYNLAAADNWMAGGAATANIADGTATINVSNVTAPAVSSAAYNQGTGVLTVTGTNFVNKVGTTNDVDVSKLTLTGEGGNTYTLTTSNVEIASATSFSVTLNTVDKLVVNGLLNKDGTQADDGATNYNLNLADDYMLAVATSTNIADTTNTVTVSNVQVPTITSATYDANSKALVVTGTGFARKFGASNDIDPTKLTLTGEASGTYTLTGSPVEITSETAFTVTLSDTDKINVNGLLNKDGTTSDDSVTYNLAGEEDWQQGAATNATIADTTGNGITVSSSADPTITSATYDYSSGVLAVTGTRFVKQPGVTNDVDVTKLTLLGEASGSRTLTTTNVEITDETSFSVTLNSADKTAVNALLNTNGTQSADTTTYNLDAADNWMVGAATSNNIADTSGNGITVSNVPAPAITSATYNYGTGVLVVTGVDFESKSGLANDVSVSKLTVTGEGSATYTLTSSDVEITNATSFSVTLNATDMLHVNGLLNKDGTQADDATVFNLAAADDFMANVTAGDTSDATNGVTVSAQVDPIITSATYDVSTGNLVVTGTNFSRVAGATNDVDPTKLTLTGDSNNTYTLTTSGVEVTNSTTFTVTLNATDQLNIHGLLNKNGTVSGGGQTYNLAAADNWLAGGAPSTDISDTASNGITVSNVSTPVVTSSTYNAGTGVLVVTGTNFVKEVGATNDVDPTKFTLLGDGNNSYTLTTTPSVEITDGTTVSLTLSAVDKTNINGLLNKDGTTSSDSTTYNLAVADRWMPGADEGTNSADLPGNSITVSGVVDPAISSVAYDGTTGVLSVTGTNFVNEIGALNDVDLTKFTLTGEGSSTYTLTTTRVEITSSTSFSATLSAADKLVVNGLLNKNGTNSGDNTLYNLAAADRWMPGAATSPGTADATTGITVSNVPTATITSATYAADTGTLVVSGTNFVSKSGATNDIDVTKLTLNGEGNNTYTLTTGNVEISSATSFTVSLNSADQTNINGLLNKNGTTADDGATYNLAAAEDWLAGAAASATIADLTSNGITVSGVASPTVTSATYDATSGALVVTGSNLVNFPGATNDVDVSLLTLTGENGNTYTLTSASDVEITSASEFTVTLTGADKTNVDGLLNKNGTASDVSSTTYNLASADNWMPGAAASVDISDTTGNGITVSNVTVPTITSATYDATTGVVVVTGTNLRNASGASNDVDVSLLTFTGDAGATYTLTSATDVEITSTTQFTLTLSGADKTNVDGLLNKNGTTSDDSTTYNLAVADNWMPSTLSSASSEDLTGNGITVSNVTTPTITSSTYDFTTGVLSVTGTNFRNLSGATNDVDTTKLSLEGEGSNSYTLTGASVDITSATAFSVTLSEADKINVNGLLNKNGTSADDATTYNLAAADDWMPSALSTTDISDASNSVTVSNVVAPTITSITYDYETGLVTVTGTNFVKQFGAANDVDISLLTFTGENGATYTLTSATDIEITSSTSFTFTLTGADLTGVNALITANGTTAGSGTTYNVSAADNWMKGAAGSTDISDTTGNTITVSNAPTPTVTSATYDASTGVLVVTGSSFVAKSGALNDVDVSKLTLTGEASGTYTLTSSDVEIDSSTQFTVTLNAADKRTVNGLLNTNGTQSDDSTAYNLAAADDFIADTTAGDSSDATGNAITVSNVVSPQITSATYDASSGSLVVTGTNFVHATGSSNDVDISLLTFTGEGGSTYTVTSASDVEVTSATQFSVTLTGQDQANINGLLNKNGTVSDDATTFNLAAADNWMTGAAAAANVADGTNGVTVSNVAAPAITSATYDATTGILVITGTNFSSVPGAANDADISALTLVGEAGNSYTITSATDVEVSSLTELSVTLTGTDKTNVDGLLNKNGTSSDDVTTYNLAAGDNWMLGAASSTDIADDTNGVTVSNVTIPTITSATYDGTSGTLVVTGTNLRNLSGAANDADFTKLTLSGQGGSTYTLTTDAVDITSATTFSAVLNTTDQSNLAVLLNKNGTSAVDATVYNLSAADDWMPGAAATTDLSDTTGNGITVSNVATPTVTLSANSNTVAEASGSSVITATLSAATSVDVTVNLAYTGTATSVADYSTTGNSITISSGALTGSVTLQAVQDASVESNETIVVDIDSITGNTATEATTQQQTVTIADDDTTTVTLAASASTIAEAAGTSTITATLGTASFEDVTVSLGYSGTATSGTDYVTPAGSITITAGQTTGSTTLTAAADSTIESDETIIVDVTGVSGGSASESGTQQQTVTITDDDTATVTLSVSDSTISEAAGTSTITATLDQATFENVTVTLGYSGTASSGIDYATPAGSITITAGQTTGSTTLTATADSSVEASETIIVDVTAVSGGSASESGTQQQTVTITDDDTTAVTLTASASTIVEASGTSTLTVSLSSATFEDVTVSLGYSGTATSGTDYATPAGSITITAGQTTGSTTLTATQDSSEESDETIIVDITGVSGGSATESGTQQQTVTITNDDNETTADTATVDEDSSVQVDVLSNDVGAGSALNPASVAIVTSATNGSTSVNTANGVITYTPTANFNGSDSFAYTVADTQGNTSASTTVTITVSAVNDAPVAVADTAVVTEDGSVVIDVLSNDTDVDGASDINSASLIISSQPTNGSVVIENEKVTYTPASDYFGSDTFEYTVSDNTGAVSSAGTVTVNVSGINDAPTVVADTVQTDEDTAVSIAVLDNDSDLDGSIDVSTITAVVEPANGTVTAQSDGSFNYTPNADFNGSDSFTYTVKDDQDAVSSQATVSITVNAVNDAPVATNDVAVLQEDSSFDINVAGNDSDVDSSLDLSSLTVTVQPAQGSVSLVNNMFRYTPNQNFDGSDSFSYTINDTEGSTSNVATVAITVQSVNDAPLANDDSVTTDEDTSVDISLLTNDQDIDGTLDATSVVTDQPSNGSIQVNNGVVTYTPAENFSGTDQFTYTVNDDSGETSNSATVTVTVTSVNDLPVISGTPATSVLEGAAYSFTPTLSDIEGDSLTVTASNLPGWMTLNSSTGALSGSPVVGDAGVYANILLQVSDGQGSTDLTAFTIEVIGDNDTDGLANSEDLDDDNDGMSDEFEIANGFDVFNPADASLDADNDGVSNLNEYDAGSNPLADDQAPLITGIQTLNINATGLLTPVTGLVSPVSVDGLDGDVEVNLVGGAPANLAPGAHNLTWFSVDAAGNRAESAQQVNVHPLISMSKDQVVGEGVNGQIRVLLNGSAPSYPLTVSYEVEGTADSTDHNLVAGDVVFEEGEVVKQIPFTITSDQTLETTEQIVVSLVGDSNFGSKKTHTITIVEENVAPQVELTITQNGETQLIVEQSSGVVNFSAQISDPNPNDQHTVEWQFTGDVVTEIVSDTQRQLNPANVEPGVYQAKVTVFDDGLPPISNEVSISYRVVESLSPLSSTQDSDGDGISDSDEGWADDDQDGQPNYLDSSNLSNVLNEVAEDGFSFLIETEPGLKLVLGERALSNDGRGAKVEEDSLPASLQIPADEIQNFSGYFDFVVNDLPVIGQSVNIVIPQRMVIPENVVYRKFDGVWYTFVEDANNALMSAPGEQGTCPPPESDEYRPGLNAGDWCVQLTIEDGGPNDADGMANGTVIDPGGVGNLLNASVKSSGSGGGSFGWGWIIMMMSMVMMKLVRQFKSVGHLTAKSLPPLLVMSMLAIPLLLVSLKSQAQDWASTFKDRSYFEVSLFRVTSSQTQRDFRNGLASDGFTVDIEEYDTDRSGHQFVLGYRYLDWSFVEVGYLDLGNVNVNFTTLTADTSDLEKSFNKHYPVTGQGLTLGNRFQAELLPDVTVFGEAGLFFWKQDIDVSGTDIEGDDANETDVYIGFGAGYQLDQHFSLNLKLRRILVDDQDVDLFGVGLGVSF